MDIPNNIAESLVKDTVKQGDIFVLDLDNQDGITPKGGDTFRNKFFVVLGFDNEGNVYGGVIVNSKINQNMCPLIRDYHMPIKAEKYSFLRYDSFIDCLQLKTASLSKFTKGKFVGRLQDDDLTLVIGTIKESPREKKANLLRFGII
jgi:hypothetical protein